MIAVIPQVNAAKPRKLALDFAGSYTTGYDAIVNLRETWSCNSSNLRVYGWFVAESIVRLAS